MVEVEFQTLSPIIDQFYVPIMSMANISNLFMLSEIFTFRKV